MRALIRSLFAASLLLSGLAAAPGAASGGVWLAGDFHVHTTYSHDSWDPLGDDNTGPDEFYTLGPSVTHQFANASTRGLDFLAITDHNDIRSQTDEGFGAFGVLGVPAYEHSLRGHAQMLGATAIYDHGDRSAAAVNAMAAQLRANGGLFQANHPTDGTIDPDDLDWRYGYDVVPDSVEVWNINPLWQPPLPSGSDHDLAIAYWEGWLNRGHRVAATGGSDNHWLSTTAIQGVGQPTTWVYASERTPAAVLEGVRAGRTTISFQPPGYGGPRVYLEADADDDGTFEAMVGDTVPQGSAIRVRLENVPPGAEIHGFTSRGEWLVATNFDGELVSPPPDDISWLRFEVLARDEGVYAARGACDPVVGEYTTYCRTKPTRIAMTSPIYFAA